MSKRSHYSIRNSIVLAVRDKEYLVSHLEKKMNTGYRTVRKICDDLALMGFVNIEKKKHPSNGRISFSVSLTDEGFKFSNKIETKYKIKKS
jgi:predicted transcriptional regulator